MSIITILRGCYSHGSIVAEKLAKKLGYGCISRDVLKVRIIVDMNDRIRCMMEREHVSSKEEALKMVEQVDEERRKWSMKLLILTHR